jgi:photosystem II stability/assembly factor-like uncharacterized protein
MSAIFCHARSAGTLVLALVVLVCAAHAQSGWTALDVPTGSDLRGVDFSNVMTGTVVGAGTTILRTTDGGWSWVAQAGEPNQSLQAVSFADDSVGVTAGFEGTILFTQNGGAVWATVQTGWMIDYHGAQMRTPLAGVVVGQNTIFQPFGSWTSDGWQTHDDFNFYIMHDGVGNEGALYDVHFFDDEHGFAAAQVWDGHGAIVETDDGGQTWTTVFWGTAGLMAMDFPSPDVAYAAGLSGLVVKTVDGGQTWEVLPFHMRLHWYDVKFVNPDTGWVAGENCAIYRTNDGGANWVSQHSGQGTLHGVDFADANVGFTVGDDGLVLRTLTGGEVRNQPPGPFRRVLPEDSSRHEFNDFLEPPVLFAWTTAHDEDGDPVTYHLYATGDDRTMCFATADTFLTSRLDSIMLGRFEVELTWRVVATDGIDSTDAANNPGFLWLTWIDAVEGGAASVPEAWSLSCYPNPFNAQTVVQLNVPKADHVSVRVYDITGRAVATLADGAMMPGQHRLVFDAGELASGLYIARLETPQSSMSRKVILLR